MVAAVRLRARIPDRGSADPRRRGLDLGSADPRCASPPPKSSFASPPPKIKFRLAAPEIKFRLAAPEIKLRLAAPEIKLRPAAPVEAKRNLRLASPRRRRASGALTWTSRRPRRLLATTTSLPIRLIRV